MRTQTEAEMMAHRVATEICRRWTAGEALGRPSLYNVVRDVLVPVLLDEGADVSAVTAAIRRDPEWDSLRGVERRRWRVDLSDGRRKFTRTRREAIEWCETIGYAVEEATS